MSQSQSQQSPYPRENFHGETGIENGVEEPTGHVEQPGTSRAKWVAKKILRQGATHLCPITLTEDPEDDEYAMHAHNRPIVLSDPEEYIVEEPSQQATSYGLYRRRVNEDLGYIVSGGTIADRPTEEFLEIVANVLAWALLTGDLRHSEADILRREAQSMKAAGELHDTQIMTEMVRAMDHSDGVEDYVSS